MVHAITVDKYILKALDCVRAAPSLVGGSALVDETAYAGETSNKT